MSPACFGAAGKKPASRDKPRACPVSRPFGGVVPFLGRPENGENSEVRSRFFPAWFGGENLVKWSLIALLYQTEVRMRHI